MAQRTVLIASRLLTSKRKYQKKNVQSIMTRRLETNSPRLSIIVQHGDYCHVLGCRKMNTNAKYVERLLQKFTI